MSSTVLTSVPATRRAGETAAEDLRSVTDASSVLVYRPHPEGGYAIQATAGTPPVGFPTRLWVDEQRWIPRGTEEHWLALPLGYEGRTGLAVVGPFPEPALSRRTRRAVQVQVVRAAEMLGEASVVDARRREEQRLALETQGMGAASDLVSLTDTLTAVKGLYEPGSHSARLLEECLVQLRSLHDVGPGGNADRAARMSALVALADAHDAGSPDMAGHADRVRRISTATAQVLGLEPDVRNDLAVAARLHDCGEAIAAGGVLDIPRLTDDQRERIREHPRIGATIAGSAGLEARVQRAIADHHERWDGHGYPDGRAGEDISVEGRIIALAEVFDALVSPRPWRGPLRQHDALDHVYEGSGSQFDPVVVEAFFVAWRQLSTDPELRTGG